MSPAPTNPHGSIATAEEPNTLRNWRQLALLSGLISMDNSESSVVSTLFPAIRAALDLKLSALGILLALSRILTMIFGPIWVAAATHFGRKKILVVCCGLWGVWSVVAGLAQSFLQLVLLYGIAAVGFAAGGPLVNAIMADLFEQRHRGRAAGWLYSGFALVNVVLLPLFGQLSRFENGWRYGFFASGVVTIAAGLLVWRYFIDPPIGIADDGTDGPAPATPGHRQLREALHVRTLWIIMLQRLTSPQTAFLAFGTTYLVDVRHWSTAQAALAAPFALSFYLAGTVFGGYAGDRAGNRYPSAGRVAIWQSSVLLWALAAALCTQVAWRSLWSYVVLFAIVGFLQGFNPGSNRPILMAVTKPELRSATFSLMLGAESAGWAISVLLLSYTGDAIGLQAASLWLVVVVGILNGLLMTFMYRPYKRESSPSRKICLSD